MPRKTAIIIASILLLIIGGGAVAFYLHLRARDRPTFSEVDQFMPALPGAMGWPAGSTSHEIKQENLLLPAKRWLRKLGIRHRGVAVLKSYHFTPAGQPDRSWFVYFAASDQGTLEDVQESGLDTIVVTGPPADAENARRALLEKFPSLRPILKVNP